MELQPVQLGRVVQSVEKLVSFMGPDLMISRHQIVIFIHCSNVQIMTALMLFHTRSVLTKISLEVWRGQLKRLIEMI